MAEAPRKSVGPGFELGRWSFFSCCLPLSSVCREVITTFLPAHKDPEQASLEVTLFPPALPLLGSAVNDSFTVGESSAIPMLVCWGDLESQQ